ncbi:MAG: hypothetical protein ACK5OP_02800 [Sphingobacteriales bacterium]|jgi:hypothetical protein
MLKAISLLFTTLLFGTISQAQTPVLDLNSIADGIDKNSKQPCGTCPDWPYKVEYNRLNNKMIKVKMKVGEPYVLNLYNVDPSQDSILIRDTTFLFNTEPSALNNILNGAKLAAAKASPVVIDSVKLSADLDSLSAQLTRLEPYLNNASTCNYVCLLKREIKKEVERYFSTTHGIPPALILPALKEVLASFVGSDKETAEKIIYQYANFLDRFSDFSYYIPQVQNVDRYVFTLSIIPKVGASSNRTVDKQPIEVSTVGGVKFDLSPGFFVTNLSDAKINLRPDSSVIRNSYGGDSIVYNRRNQITQEDTKGFSDLGFAGFLHIYPRLSDIINGSFSLGVGTTISNKPKPRYLAGINLIVGVKQRFSIGAGFAAGNVEVLQQGYASGDFISSSKPESITTTTFKIKHYLAVSYNIPLGKVSEK